MKYHVLTLFPEMIEQGMHTSILKRAMEKGCISLECVNIRDFSKDKHMSVDDYPYGGGAGMLMQAEPVYEAWKSIEGHEHIKTLYMSPKGRTFNQKVAEELSLCDELIFLCGHYEGIDERALEKIGVECISIGDYVLTGGELPAMVMMDCISRFLPGVLNNQLSSVSESFTGDLLEYPQYTRPEIWQGMSVPKVLLSGNHKDIVAWEKEEALRLTKSLRPDMYERYEEKSLALKLLMKKKRENACIIDDLLTGEGELISFQNGISVVYHLKSHTLMAFGEGKCSMEDLPQTLPEDIVFICTNLEELLEDIRAKYGFKPYQCCYQSVYTRPEKLPVEHKDIRTLSMEHFETINANYEDGEMGVYIKNRILNQAMFGAFKGEEMIGFCGVHIDGSLGMLYVKEEYRRGHTGSSLASYLVNYALQRGLVPYAHIEATNEKSLKMQESMGLYLSKKKIYWLKA